MKRLSPDWLLYGIVIGLMGIGIANLYSLEGFPPLAWKHAYTRQLVWAGGALLVMGISSLVEGSVWRYFSYMIYGGGLIIMLITPFIGQEVSGARAWLEIGALRIQPSEFMKIATALALAAYLSHYDFHWERWRDRILVSGLILAPIGLTLLQRDTGTALTFAAFLVPLYRWGLSGSIIVLPLLLGGLSFLTLIYPWVYIGLALTLIVLVVYAFVRRYVGLHLVGLGFLWGWLALSQVLYTKVLAPHQRQRIQVLLDPYQDRLGAGWNIIQAQLAVVAGGISGQGYGKGRQSKLDFIPQRHTDFAFCGIAEEWGWIGSTALILLYVAFLSRLVWIAEKSNSPFALVYGYGFSAVLWFHLLINLAMILGLFPVVGIPLMLISYGGSSWVAVGWGVGILQSFYRERRMRLFG